MPLAVGEHSHEKIEAFLWGLLPDNELVLGRWAHRFQVSARNAFSLVSYIGEDCPGAVQFVRPERLDAILTSRVPEIDWLDEADVAERLRSLRADQSAWRMPHDTGQFSLAGAQPKTALIYDGGRWGVPSGRMPTTHIFKPPTGEFDGHAENEHFCLMLARELGLPAASSEIMRFDGETAIVIERFDRIRTSGMAAAAAMESASHAAATAPMKTEDAPDAAKAAADAAARAHALGELAKTQPILRLHQEDICQALGLQPIAKYQNDGGPSPEDIVALLRTHSSRPIEDIGAFVDALAFNWFIAGTDAHAKNYSLLHGGGGRVRLAPLYDVAGALPYLDPQQIKLAMKIGDKYRIRDIGPRQWRKLATGTRLDPDQTMARLVEFASNIPERVALVHGLIRGEGITHPIIDRLAEAITARAAQCLRMLRL